MEHGSILNGNIRPRRVSSQWQSTLRELYAFGDTLHKKRTICDFIAGMTDRYAVEFYSRLFGANGMTMHKPL
ncbi:hypothetical protein [Shinella sp. M31]|uniref:hypothetical protein n=1 Tax=Shinella sp. M31 TaxID=3368615 RepID=UPI003BA0B696